MKSKLIIESNITSIKQFILIVTIVFNFNNLNAQCNQIDLNKITALTEKVSKQHLDNNKIKLIQEYLNTDCINTTQLTTLIQLLNFEEDKITIIKKAYLKIEDPSNINEVLKKLEFETSKKEILNFIKGLKQ